MKATVLAIMSLLMIGTATAAAPDPTPSAAGPPPATSTPPPKSVANGLAKKKPKSDAAKAKEACRKTAEPNKKC